MSSSPHLSSSLSHNYDSHDCMRIHCARTPHHLLYISVFTEPGTTDRWLGTERRREFVAFGSDVLRSILQERRTRACPIDEGTVQHRGLALDQDPLRISQLLLRGFDR